MSKKKEWIVGDDEWSTGGRIASLKAPSIRINWKYGGPGYTPYLRFETKDGEYIGSIDKRELRALRDRISEAFP